MPEPGELICPFCSAPYTEGMVREYHTTCGEGTCDNEHVVIYCASCKRAVYTKGLYGPVEREEVEQITQEDVESWLREMGEDEGYYDYHGYYHEDDEEEGGDVTRTLEPEVVFEEEAELPEPEGPGHYYAQNVPLQDLETGVRGQLMVRGHDAGDPRPGLRVTLYAEDYPALALYSGLPAGALLDFTFQVRFAGVLDAEDTAEAIAVDQARLALARLKEALGDEGAGAEGEAGQEGGGVRVPGLPLGLPDGAGGRAADGAPPVVPG